MKTIIYLLLILLSLWHGSLYCAEQNNKAQETHKIRKTLQNQMIQAKHYQKLGRHEQTINLLEDALPLAKQADTVTYSTLLTELGDAYLVIHQWEKATAYMTQAVNQAYESENYVLQAYTLNNLGNLLLLSGYYPQAKRTYASSMELIKAHELDNVLASRVVLNQLRLHIKTLDQTDIMPKVIKLKAILDKLESNKLTDLVSLMQLLIQTYPQHYPVNEDLHAFSYRLAVETLALARAQQNIYAISYGHMYLGQLFEQQKKYIKALAHNSDAIFYAQQYASPQILYQAYWQKGRILNNKQETSAAIHAYRKAITFALS